MDSETRFLKIRAHLILIVVFSAPLRAATPPNVDLSARSFSEAEAADAVAYTQENCTVQETVGPADTGMSPELIGALLARPDLCGFIAKRRKLAPYTITRLSADRWSGDDGVDTSGVAQLVEFSRLHRTYYADGVNRTRFLPSIRATVTVDLDLVERTEADGRASADAVFRVCVRARSSFISTLAKTLAPFVRRAVQRKFTTALRAAARVGRLTVSDPQGLAADVAAFPALAPEESAALLARLAAAASAPPSRK